MNRPIGIKSTTARTTQTTECQRRIDRCHATREAVRARSIASRLPGPAHGDRAEKKKETPCDECRSDVR